MTRPDSIREWPTIYDIQTDSNRPVTQQDIDVLQLRTQIGWRTRQIMALLVKGPRNNPKYQFDRLTEIAKFIEKYDMESVDVGPKRVDEQV